MKYLVSLFVLALSVNSYASESCHSEIEAHAHKTLGLNGGTTVLNGIEATDQFIKPGEDRGYLQGEIWQDKGATFDAQIYEVSISVYSASTIIYAYLMNPETCKVAAFIEVFYE